MTIPEKIYIVPESGKCAVFTSWREDFSDVEYVRVDVHENEIEAIRKSSFESGVKALFDKLIYRSANNWHANPILDKECKRENDVIIEWVTDVLESVSSKTCAVWAHNEQTLTVENQTLKEENTKLKKQISSCE